MTDERLTTEELADQAERGDQSAHEADGTPQGDGREPLLEQADLDHLRNRWESIQSRFVDEPRGSVERADTLVAELMQRLTRQFADERARLEAQWERDEDVSTEELRVSLTRYRSFFDRLLAA